MHRFNRKSPSGRSFQSLSMETLEPRVMLAADLHNLAMEPAHILNPYADDAVTVDQMIARAQEVPYVPGDLIVALEMPYAANSVQNEFYLDTVRWSDLTEVKTQFDSTLMQVDLGHRTSFVMVQLDIGGADLFETMTGMQEKSHVLWTSPNFFLEGDQRDYVPNDPDYGQQYTHSLVGSEAAWDITLGDSNIVVGITDDGVDLVHPDLAPNIWINAGEIPGNGLDDDNNGYIDDVNGWDWANGPGGNNDPSPDGGSHGTHVAGISAARTDNGIGIAGLSGRSTIMPLQFYGGSNAWTAAIINDTFTYAADNGAHIVNTSYNINGWVGDPVFTAGMQYMYDNGVLHFNSAGNGNELNPARQAFEQTFLVVSTTSSDTRSSFSNYGTGVDISAPGSSVYSTLPGNSYGNNSGTSMAAPNAAGAAALIWSANPTWTRDQVVTQLLATADDIDALNPGYAGLLGAGRINVERALTETIGAPTIAALVDVPANGGVTNDLTIDQFGISFSQVMDPASVNNNANYELRNAGVDGVFGNADDDIFGITMNGNYQLSTNRLTFAIDSGALPYGEYQITVEAAVMNPFGTSLDGNNDGTAGDAFVSRFTVEPPPPVSILPSGSLIYHQSFPGSIGSAETDQFAIALDANQTLTVIVEGEPGLVPTLNIYDPSSQQVDSVTGTGSSVISSVVPLDTAGEWMFELMGDAGSTGSYQLTWLLNSGMEAEETGIGDNNSLATAQDINPTALNLGSGQADRLAVIGTLPTSDGIPVYEDGFESGSLGSQWTTSSTATGQIQVTGLHGTASGNFALIMDSTTDSSYSRNEAIWTVDLSGVTSPSLIFDHAEFNDEEDALPATFTDSVDGDGVSISDDGVNWYRVFDPASQTTGVWNHINIDLEDAANNAGMTLGPNFQIKFQQYDNFSLTTDGRGFDNISINEPGTEADWYSFELQDGQTATVAATKYQGPGSVLVELFDSSGSPVQTGGIADNVDSFIGQFVDPTTNGVADSWYLRVSGQDASYSLLATRNAEFDLEPNDPGTAQNIEGLAGVLGYVSTFSEQSGEPDDYNDGDVLDNVIPGVTLSNPVGGTTVNAATATFGAPTGTLVFSPAPGNASGWSDDADELRADFANPTSFVSIDVGSDDASDVGFLRAYDASDNLLEEVISGSVATGGSETISITRPTADIAYIVASGLGGDITPLDNLVFGTDGSEDNYLIDGIVGQEIRYDAFLPGEGPNWFINGLDTPAGSDLRLELFQAFGAGLSVATGINSIAYAPTLAGQYRLVVTSNGGAGEYYLERNAGSAQRFDFGTVSSPVQIDWVGVGADAYDAVKGYGWRGTTNNLSLVDDGVGNNVSRDYAQLAVGEFVVDVPDGDYLITVHFSESAHGDDVRIGIEGGSYVFTPATNQIEVFKTEISDGQVNIDLSGNLGLDEFVRIAGLEIVERTSNLQDGSGGSEESPESLARDYGNAMRPESRSTLANDSVNQRPLDDDSLSLALSGMLDADTKDSVTEWQTSCNQTVHSEATLTSAQLGKLFEEIFKDPFAA